MPQARPVAQTPPAPVRWNLGGANGLAIFLPLGEQDYRPTKADPNDSTKSLAERQLTYYADPSQLTLTHDAPQWAALLVRLESTVPIIRTGPGGLPTTAGVASLAATPSIDTRAFATPAQVIPVVVPTYSISGTVRDASNVGVSGVTVSAGAGHSATTAADGSYTIGNLPTGSYTLTLSLSGYTFNPQSKQVTVTANVSGQDFTASVIDIKRYVYLPMISR